MDDFDLVDISEDEVKVPSNEETVEMLDFENDIKVSTEIDEMLDFIDITPKEKQKQELDKLLDNISDSSSVLKLEEPTAKLDDYTPSIKDFNIKSAKARKIVKKAMLYVIIVMLLGFEFFITKAGDTLNDLRVYASDIEPIKIIQNEKYGYIDYTGRKIVNPKYSYGEDFINGYAIVKDSSNLPLIIDKGGKQEVVTGTYFSLYRAGEDIIASKVTKKGLKYGILKSDLSTKTKFIYDSINYVDGAYTYVLENEVGVINMDGKPIYSYKLTDKDDKRIDVLASEVSDDKSVRYAVVIINSSSSIINLTDGKVVYSPTLNIITPEENNVFSVQDKSGYLSYLYIYNNDVVLERMNVNSVSVPSINSGIITVLNKNYTYEYISVSSKEQIKKNLTKEKVYYSDNYFIYNNYNYKTNKEELVFVTGGEIKKVVNKDFEMESKFVNGVAIIKFDDEMYSYIDEQGNIITELRFIQADSFDKYGDAVAKTNDGYGVLNKEGKIVIPFNNNEIKMLNSNVKINTQNESNVFYAVKKDNRFALYNSSGKRRGKKYYNDIIFDEKYPLFKASDDAYDLLITSKDLDEIKLTSFNSEYKAYENYIIVKNEYYNYNGKNIYIDNSVK